MRVNVNPGSDVLRFRQEVLRDPPTLLCTLDTVIPVMMQGSA